MGSLLEMVGNLFSLWPLCWTGLLNSIMAVATCHSLGPETGVPPHQGVAGSILGSSPYTPGRHLRGWRDGWRCIAAPQWNSLSAAHCAHHSGDLLHPNQAAHLPSVTIIFTSLLPPDWKETYASERLYKEENNLFTHILSVFLDSLSDVVSQSGNHAICTLLCPAFLNRMCLIASSPSF